MLLAQPIQLRVHSRPDAPSLADTVDAPTDHELMIAVRAGEIRRLGDLFERYHKPLYGFFVRLTNQPSVGEDLVQIVFYRILKYRHTYRDEGKFSAWIYHLARKVAADHFRKHASTPPSARFASETLPPCRRATSWAMASPRPEPLLPSGRGRP